MKIEVVGRSTALTLAIVNVALFFLPFARRGKRLWRLSRTLCLVAIMVASSRRCARADIVNGDFSSGNLNGWTVAGTSGSVFITSGFGNPAPSAEVVGTAPFSPYETLSQQFQINNPNDYSNILAFDIYLIQGPYEANLYVDGTRVPNFFSFPVGFAQGGFARWYALLPGGNHTYTLEFGSAGFAFNGPPISGSLLVDNFATNQALPPSERASGKYIFESSSGTGNWFDPTAASGFIYATDGNSKFTQIIVPQGLGDLDGKYTITDAINGTKIIDAGTVYTFATAVDTFTLSGIDPTVDGDNPVSFPTYLKFDQDTVNFTMTPVPEPPGFILMLLAAAVGMGVHKLHRREV